MVFFIQKESILGRFIHCNHFSKLFMQLVFSLAVVWFFCHTSMFFKMKFIGSIVELPYISCKNLANVVHSRRYLQESCKNLTFQTNLSDSGTSDISCKFRRFWQDSCRSRRFLQDSCRSRHLVITLFWYNASSDKKCTAMVELMTLYSSVFQTWAKIISVPEKLSVSTLNIVEKLLPFDWSIKITVRITLI